MGTVYQFKGLLTEEGWLADACVSLDNNGQIIQVGESLTDIDRVFNAYALPGFQNAHSHSFQYAMAGLAELHTLGSNPDDFWSWREAMYNLALKISPDQLEAIARMLYSEMLRHGYTHVAEFHYVHHDQNGDEFSNLSEMGERLVAAASEVGIGITLVPIFYQKGGFGKEPTAGQRRFISPTVDDYMKLVEASKKSVSHYKRANVALGIHSLRAVDAASVVAVCASMGSEDPLHIHIAEQLKEIEDSVEFQGQRPVEWLLDNVNVNESYHLVHATHLTDQECDGIAQSGARVVLCPTTEGNLGDGIFPLRRFQEKGGQWSIGTDSHVSLNPLEELRILDYGQRLISHRRNTFNSESEGNSALYGINQAYRNGRGAMGAGTEFYKPGDTFNAVLYDASAPLLTATSLENIGNAIIYSQDFRSHVGTISGGALVCENGKHKSEERTYTEFRSCLTELSNR